MHFWQVKRVAILGLGNVALDCARVLLQPVERLKTTDIASHALAQLQESGVQQVDLIGRRGPAQASKFPKHQQTVGCSKDPAGCQYCSDPHPCNITRSERIRTAMKNQIWGRGGMGGGGW